MAETPVKIETKDRICILTLNDPEKLNAMTDDMAVHFSEAVNKIKEDSGLRALILTGAGRAFSAGGNLPRMLERADANPISNRKNILSFYQSFLRIMELDIPTIAAINGHAIGAGACVSLACDMRLASQKSKMGFTFAKIGLHPGMGAEYFLTRLIGRARTFELLMTGDIISAEEAFRIGLINHVVPDDELMDKAMELAGKIADMPALPIRLLKESIDTAMNDSLTDTLNREAVYQAVCYAGEDIREGITALQEKRKPRFTDEY
jgi:enoyl-CoA hydratase